MHHFFLPADAFLGDVVRFPADIARQMRSVLRLRPGEQVLALDGEGAAYLATLTHLQKGSARARILGRRAAGGEPAGELTLCQAISKGDRFEWTLQKGVELGVTTFQPMLTKRTLRRNPGAGRWQRWRRIIREAAEQSGRGKLPRLLSPISFEDAVAGAGGTRLAPTVFARRSAVQALADAAWPVTLFVGPEGGFDPDEVALAQAAGVSLVSLGPRTLRTETAAIVLTTLAMAALGEMDFPGPRA